MLSGPDQQQFDRVLSLVHDVLGPDVAGAYLFGSAVLSGLRPQSDLDVLVVSRRPTTREDKQRLVRDLLAMSGRVTTQGFEDRIDPCADYIVAEIKALVDK